LHRPRMCSDAASPALHASGTHPGPACRTLHTASRAPHAAPTPALALPACLPAPSHAHDAATGAEEWRVLKLDRTSPELDAAEDPTPYTKPQMQRLLAAIHAGKWAGQPREGQGRAQGEFKQLGHTVLVCLSRAALLPASAAAAPLPLPSLDLCNPPHAACPQATRRTAGCSWCARPMPLWAACAS